MVVAENWVPFESIYEQKLIEVLAKVREQSTKGLRYTLAADQPIVAAIFAQRQPQPLALYIIPPGADDGYHSALEEMIASRPEIESWVWNAGDGEMPILPLLK
jgi:hypothetical protein